MDINETLKQRGTIHGPWASDSGLSQDLKAARRKWTLHPEKPAFIQEALDMICTKMARIEVGDCLEVDHFLDISGYATLVVQELRKAQEWADCEVKNTDKKEPLTVDQIRRLMEDSQKLGYPVECQK